jgi:hypothetical protein
MRASSSAFAKAAAPRNERDDAEVDDGVALAGARVARRQVDLEADLSAKRARVKRAFQQRPADFDPGSGRRADRKKDDDR